MRLNGIWICVRWHTRLIRAAAERVRGVLPLLGRTGIDNRAPIRVFLHASIEPIEPIRINPQERIWGVCVQIDAAGHSDRVGRNKPSKCWVVVTKTTIVKPSLLVTPLTLESMRA